MLYLPAYLCHDRLDIVDFVDDVCPLVVLVDCRFGIEETRHLWADCVFFHIAELARAEGRYLAEQLFELCFRVVDGIADLGPGKRNEQD